MTEKRKRILNLLTIAGFSLYFIILFSERLAAVILSPTHGAEYALNAKLTFNYIAYAVTALSLAAGSVLFVRLFVKVGRSIRGGEGYDFEEHAKEWCVAAAVMLFGGMMHTGFTLAGVQFVSYGFLIGAMIVKCVACCMSGEDKTVAILSVVYITLFSMSIPVCYISFMRLALRVPFFLSEFLAVLLLVPAFGWQLLRYMSRGVADFTPVIPCAMALLSGAVVALQWTEDVNLFVLIFAVLTLVCYCASVPILRKRLSHTGSLLSKNKEGSMQEEQIEGEGQK